MLRGLPSRFVTGGESGTVTAPKEATVGNVNEQTTDVVQALERLTQAVKDHALVTALGATSATNSTSFAAAVATDADDLDVLRERYRRLTS